MKLTRREAGGAISGLLLTGCDRLRSTGRVADPAELELDYSIMIDPGATGAAQPATVNEKHAFRGGDRFRVQFRPAFPAYLYLLNRGAGESEYSFLYPARQIAVSNPLSAEQSVTLPGDSEWYTLDSRPGIENLVLIAALQPVTELPPPDQKLSRDDGERILAMLERDRRPKTSRRVEDPDHVRLFASRDANSVILARLPLEHR